MTVKPVSVNIPIYLGNKKLVDYGISLFETKFKDCGIPGYTFVRDGDNNDTIILQGQGYYTKGTLMKVLKEAIFEDINSKNGQGKSPLRYLFERPLFHMRND